MLYPADEFTRGISAARSTQMIQDAVNLKALSVAEDQSTAKITEFLTIQKKLNSVSASPPNYVAACQYLDLDPQIPTVGRWFYTLTKCKELLGSVSQD